MAALLSPIDVLGGERSIGKNLSNPFRMIARVRAGLPYKALESLAAAMHLSTEEMSGIFSIPPRTLARRKRSHKLNAGESDRIYRVARVFSHATQLLGDAAEAAQWFRAPHIALNMTTPLELLDTDAGTLQVEEILGRIEHGLYS
jgi:putative toxin-antitoxin system antitoxin component (TIGR02293 family)